MFCWACDERHWSMGWIKPSRRRLLNKMPLFLRRDKSKLAETILWNGSQSSYFLSYICRKECHENGLFFCWEQSTHISSSLNLHYRTLRLVVLFSTKCLSVLLFRKKFVLIINFDNQNYCSLVHDSYYILKPLFQVLYGNFFSDPPSAPLGNCDGVSLMPLHQQSKVSTY